MKKQLRKQSSLHFSYLARERLPSAHIVALATASNGMGFNKIHSAEDYLYEKHYRSVQEAKATRKSSRLGEIRHDEGNQEDGAP